MNDSLLLRYKDALLEAVVAAPSVIIALFDGEWKVLDCNEGAQRTCGGIPTGHSLLEYVLDVTQLPALPEPNSSTPVTLILRTSSGDMAAVAGTVSALDGTYLLVGIPSTVGTDDMILQMSRLTDQLTDVTREVRRRNSELEQANKTITALMNTDVLTDLPNRRSFLAAMPAALSFSRRTGQPLSLLMADLDNFKHVNDTFGHDEGDVVLKTFAAVLRSSCRLEDTPCRFGGEEFLLLLPNTDLTGAVVVAERLRTRTIESVRLPDGSAVSASFGATLFHEDDTQDTFLKRVDDALYEAKNTGRNRTVAVP
ncbi:MAG: GGDEF domain-containing protein [Halothiobacillaceae bacterium]